MQALVTGGGGFIGSHLADRLVMLGHDVRILDNFATGRAENLDGPAGEAELLQGDVRHYEDVAHAIRGCEVVLHQAALPSVPRSVRDPFASHETNATGTLNVLLAALEAGARRVVLASSSSVYGGNPGLPKREEMTPLPVSPYAAGKLAAESYCRAFNEVYPLETVALRYFNVFGPRQDPSSQYAAAIPKFIGALLAGRPPRVFGDGEQSRDFTFVGNVVDANLCAMVAPAAPGKVYNVACGKRTTVNQLIGALERQLGTHANPVYEPARPGDVRHSLADTTKAQRDLGWSPRVSASAGLSATVEYFRTADQLADVVGF
jgi:nucleoside-diphosphate-sugar epimerase